ncbi:hypothetical protein GF371_04845 [Candidatus Woesearchaeota archaeon]|nr:hypothetical protein [Candidatus Woesearchaeota archaeon]
MKQKKQREEQPLDPKIAIELKKLERNLKKAFTAVKRDINIFYGEFARFKLSTSNQINKLKLSDDKVDKLLVLNKSVEKLNSIVEGLEYSMKKFADKESTKEELSEIKKRFSDYVEKSDYNDRLKEVDKQLEIRNVKLIDLAKIETKINSIKKDVNDLSELDNDLKSLKENFLKFKKSALTKYNVEKHEKWVKELEKDLLQLISLRKKVDALSTVKEVEGMRRIAAQNIKEQEEMKNKFDNISRLKQDFDKFKADSEKEAKKLGKELAAANSSLARLQKSQDSVLSELKEAKRIARVEKNLDQLSKKVKKLEKVKPKVIVKEKKTAKAKPKKSKKSKKGKKGTAGQRFFDWLVEE